MAATPRPVLGVALACTAQFLLGADGLAVTVAVPAMQRDFDATVLDAQWILTAYGLTFGSGLLVAGRLGDLFGRRRLFVAGLALFAVGSAVAALAPGLAVLVAARAAQGGGSAAAIPAALALIGSMFESRAERNRALALLAGITSLGILVGLVLGGLVTSAFGWRWIYGATVPLALLCVLAAPKALPESRAPLDSRRIDVLGTVLLATGCLALLFGLTRVEHRGLGSVLVLGFGGGGIVLLALFVLWERRVADPLVRLGSCGCARCRSRSSPSGSTRSRSPQ